MLKSITILLIGASVMLAGSIAGLVFVILKLDPKQILNLLLLYADVFVLIASLTLLIGFYARRVLGAREQVVRHFNVSLRQAIWFSIAIIVSLILLSLGLFNWWNAVLLALCLTFLESYFLFK